MKFQAMQRDEVVNHFFLPRARATLSLDLGDANSTLS
jgi:hypothetical protein